LLLSDDRQASAALAAADAPVRLSVPDEELERLRARLRSTRWLPLPQADSWRRGANLDYLRDLVDYWADGYDWRARERRLNALPNRVARVGADAVHFLHARSPERDALPLLIVHGWPSAPFEFAGVLDSLTHGAPAGDAFHVVVVSMPGFLLSGTPSAASYDVRDAAETVRALMALLGYERYGAHGGDWGAMVAAWLGHLVPERLAGLHLTTVVAPRERTAEERSERAYQELQATKPDALAVALGDSPAGLATWLVDKYRAWSDCEGDVERVFDRDLLLDLCTLYWVTGTIGASMRLYFNTRASGRVPLAAGPIDVPTGCAMFGRDLTRTPRSAAERAYRVERWTSFPRGGHFPALERPAELVEDIRAFFRPLR
jgi:pimeloyl-ACP methyl ester carboxylesterase